MRTALNKPADPLSQIYADLEPLRHTSGHQLADRMVADIFANAHLIASQVIQQDPLRNPRRRSRLDQLTASRLFGYPLMLLLLVGIFWLTISGSNLPSEMLSRFFFRFQDILSQWFQAGGAPLWLHGILVLGIYRTSAWVISVMLPPMAIFFPLFTLLEDLGYLPRIAFNLDSLFKKANACGKQCLTMCMGFGCNAAGVVSSRIIDSPRERLIAILTNNFVPCNGRFPTLIAITAIFTAGSAAFAWRHLLTAAAIALVICLGIAFTFAVSWGLSRTLLKGEPSSLVLELPPYRLPKFGAVLYRSLIDRTFFVLRRAVVVAAPAGAVIWALSNIYLGELNLIAHGAAFLEPLARLIGLDGFILMAFILGLPANEIVIPILLMSYLSTGSMLEIDSLAELGTILFAHGWTWLTAVNVLLFSLLHWPCSTALLSAYKETGSKKWTLLAFAIPTFIAFSVCFFVTQAARLLGWA
ncbi:MAG: ferrous iron transporter B [Peptococcaceae bacterium]|jgi:ferrous iron transport protein B|nr:ferrous iron transporter B [Peptococcaceae bacterium]